ncbi:MAG: hypothetical protein AB7E32_16095 [Desulfovibrio sp.]
MPEHPDPLDIPQQKASQESTRPRIHWRGDKLVALAKKRYCAELTVLETKILQSVGAGKEYDCGGQEVDADFLVWMCTDERAREVVPHAGVILRHALFSKKINLSFAVVPFPVRWFECAFRENINLYSAHLHSLFLDNSNCNGIRAEGLATQGGLHLSAITNNGAIRLPGANIGGDIACNNAKLTAPIKGADQGRAFGADGLTTKGVITFDSAEVHGVIRLLGANIGGDVNCSNAKLTAPIKGADQGQAFIADGLTTKGGLYFRGSETKVQGAIRLLGATIGGNLDCANAKFLPLDSGENQDENPEPVLFADKLTLGGNLFLREGFQAAGRISLVRAAIQGGLCLTCLEQPERTTLDLRHAQADFLYDDQVSWPARGNLFLDNFTYNSIFEDSPTDFDARKDWLSRMPDDGKFRPQPYEQLARVLREAGHTYDAKKILMEKNRIKASKWTWRPMRTYEELMEDAVNPDTSKHHAHKIHPVSKAWYFLSWAFIGYGYSPLRTFVWMLAFIILGWFIFHHAHDADLMAKLQESSIQQNKTTTATFASDPYPEFSSLFYSLDSFVPLVDLHQETYWMPNVNMGAEYGLGVLPIKMRSGGWLRLYLWIHILMGWILTSLFVVGLTGMMRKDE